MPKHLYQPVVASGIKLLEDLLDYVRNAKTHNYSPRSPSITAKSYGSGFDTYGVLLSEVESNSDSNNNSDSRSVIRRSSRKSMPSAWSMYHSSRSISPVHEAQTMNHTLKNQRSPLQTRNLPRYYRETPAGSMSCIVGPGIESSAWNLEGSEYLLRTQRNFRTELQAQPVRMPNIVPNTGYTKPVTENEAPRISESSKHEFQQDRVRHFQTVEGQNNKHRTKEKQLAKKRRASSSYENKLENQLLDSMFGMEPTIKISDFASEQEKRTQVEVYDRWLRENIGRLPEAAHPAWHSRAHLLALKEGLSKEPERRQREDSRSGFAPNLLTQESKKLQDPRHNSNQNSRRASQNRGREQDRQYSSQDPSNKRPYRDSQDNLCQQLPTQGTQYGSQQMHAWNSDDDNCRVSRDSSVEGLAEAGQGRQPQSLQQPNRFQSQESRSETNTSSGGNGRALPQGVRRAPGRTLQGNLPTEKSQGTYQGRQDEFDTSLPAKAREDLERYFGQPSSREAQAGVVRTISREQQRGHQRAINGNIKSQAPSKNDRDRNHQRGYDQRYPPEPQQSQEGAKGSSSGQRPDLIKSYFKHGSMKDAGTWNEQKNRETVGKVKKHDIQGERTRKHALTEHRGNEKHLFQEVSVPNPAASQATRVHENKVGGKADNHNERSDLFRGHTLRQTSQRSSGSEDELPFAPSKPRV